MGKFIDLTGQSFGRLTVIKRADNIGKFTAWQCECECGNSKAVQTGHLRMGRIVSCGCWRAENSKNRATKHGHWGSKLHSIWLSMRQRCKNPKNKSFSDYGGRGIQVCETWDSFEEFERWSLTNGYKEGLSIDRIDNEGNYAPNNCRWIPLEKQQSNTRKSRIVNSPLGRMTLAELSKKSGISYGTLLSRIKAGVPSEELLKPVKD